MAEALIKTNNISSFILMEQPDKTFRGIYCNYDGHIEHNGAILNKFYNTKEKVEELLDLGDLSELGVNISNNEPNHCIAYRRDKGETKIDTAPTTFNSLDEINDCCWQDYIYIFDSKNNWKVFQPGEKEAAHSLEQISNLDEVVNKAFDKISGGMTK